VRFLRLSYAIVTAFWTGFFFVFCLQVLLFLFLDLAIQAGATSKQEASWGKALGAILAFPGFVYGLSCALVIAGAYIMDTWRGHYLIRNFTFKSMAASTVEWTFFLFFLGLPLLVMCLTLLSRRDDWWEITILFWFSCVVAFYIIFAANVVFYEMQACWQVTKNKNKKENDGWLTLILSSIYSRQCHMYSGRLTVSFLAMGSIRDSEYTDSASRSNMVDSTYKETMSWRSKWTTWSKFSKETGWGFFEAIEPKKERIYTIDDARYVLHRDFLPFI
jgi:lipase ATG15